MQQTSLLFPRKIAHPLAAKTLTIVLSIGAHYLIASNLGIFGAMTPPQLKPVRGTVKVVDLTQAERTRVPEAVKSNPLPIAQNPVNPAPATRSFSGFSNAPRTDQGNSTPSTPPSPVNTPSPSSSSSKPKTSPSSSSTSKPSKPKGTTLGFDRNNKFGSIDNNSTTPVEKPGTRKDPDSSRRSNNGSTNNDDQKDELERKRREEEDRKKREQEDKKKREEEERKKREEEENKKKNSQLAVTRQFNQEVVGDLQRKYPGLQPEKVSAENPNQYKRSIPACDKSQDTYVTVGVLYPVFKSDNPYDEAPLPEPYYRISGNAKDPEFIKQIKAIAYQSLTRDIDIRLEKIPSATRYSVPRFFFADFVYSAKSCAN